MANTMIVKNITNIQYFTERFKTIDDTFTYSVKPAGVKILNDYADIEMDVKILLRAVEQ